MKAEVLAEWRTRLADRTLITLPAGAVERVLDERLKLLEALDASRKAFDLVGPLAAGLRSMVYKALAFADEP